VRSREGERLARWRHADSEERLSTEAKGSSYHIRHHDRCAGARRHGSMAEKINLLVAGGTRYYSGKVTITAASSASVFSTQPLSIGKLPLVKSVPGVAEVSAGIGTLLSTDASTSFGMPAMIEGSDMRGQDLESFKVSYSQGRALTSADVGSVVVGADLVKKLSAKVGGFVTIRGNSSR